MEASSDSQLREVKLYDQKVTVRLVAQEQQDQREVYIARSNSTTVVANVICLTDSGEHVKVTLWGSHVSDYYEMFHPGHLLELTSFKAVPAKEGQFRVGHMHFELTSQQAPFESTVRILQKNYKLQGPPKSYASVVTSNVPGRHKIEVRVLDNFVKSGDLFLGSVLMEDFTVDHPLKIVVTLQEVYAIERHRLVRGQEMILVGTVEKRENSFYMNVLSWSDVKFPGLDDCDESEAPQTIGRNRSSGSSKVAGGVHDGKLYQRPSVPVTSSVRDRSSGYSIPKEEQANSTRFDHGRGDLRRLSVQDQSERSPSYGRESSVSSYNAYERRETTLGFSKRNEAEASSMRLSSHDRGKLRGADGIENNEPPTSLGRTRNRGFASGIKQERAELLDGHSRYVADAPNAESHRFVEFAQMKGPGKKSVRLSHQPASTDPAPAVCPPLTEYTSVTELEEVDLFVNPWHMIRGEISEPFELKEVHHCGEILMEDEDGACMTVRVRIRCVPSSKEGRLVPGAECSVKGYVRQRFDSEFELEARWGDVVFDNDSFSEPDNDDQGDFVLGPHYSAVELKKLDARRRIRIQGDVVRPFEEVGNKYEGIVKVKNVGTQCVRVCFDWIAIEEEPQDFILQIRKGVEVEVMGWAERRGAAVFMDALLIEILEDAPMENRRASSGQGTPASGSAAHMSFAFDSLKGGASIQDTAMDSRKKEYDVSGSSSPRDPYVSNGDQGLLQHDDYSSDDCHALGTAGLGSALSLAPIKFPSRGLNKDDTPSSCEAAPKSARSSRKPPRARKIPPPPSPKKLRSKTVETKTSTDTEGSPVLTGDGGQNNKGIGPIRQGTGHEATFEQSREESMSLEQSPDTAHVKPSSHDLQRVKEKDNRKRKSSSDEPALPVDCENQKEPADLSSNAALKPVSRKGWSKGK